jgi:hypothetical protein
VFQLSDIAADNCSEYPYRSNWHGSGSGWNLEFGACLEPWIALSICGSRPVASDLVGFAIRAQLPENCIGFQAAPMHG